MKPEHPTVAKVKSDETPSPIPEEHADRRVAAQVFLALGSAALIAAITASVRDASSALVGSMAGIGSGVAAAGAIMLNGLAMRRSFRAAVEERRRAVALLSQAEARQGIVDERLAAADKRTADAILRAERGEALIRDVRAELSAAVARAVLEREAAVKERAAMESELRSRDLQERGWLLSGELLNVRIENALIDIGNNQITFDVLLYNRGRERIEATDLVLQGISVDDRGITEGVVACLGDSSLPGRQWRRHFGQWIKFSFSVSPDKGRLDSVGECVAKFAWAGGTYALKLPNHEEVQARILWSTQQVKVKRPAPRTIAAKSKFSASSPGRGGRRG